MMPPTDGPEGDPVTWGRVQDLFHEALELDSHAREEFLTALDVSEPKLGHEIRSLLVAHASSRRFLEVPSAESIAAAAVVGVRLGPYRIVEEIARGGMGVVYRATRDDDSFSRDVAIKLIDPAMRSDVVTRRFRAERRILGMLEHPNIARLLDAGTTPDGSPYLVMEHISGVPLLKHCDANRLTVDERLALFLMVCDAVQFAHQRLIVHRDLKPDNILVTADGTPHLLDFGIAKLLSPEIATAGTLTSPMHRMMTPDYASPEQVRGDPVTVASDVYSLGVILYELLTGSRPYRFTTRSPEEILRVVMQADPDLPSLVAARSAVDGATGARRRRLAGDLDYVMLKALERDPARRYGMVEQLAQDIRRHLSSAPVLARGRSTTYLLSRFLRRHRAAVITTGIVVASLLAGFAGTIWQARVASLERDRATRRFEDVRTLAHAVVFDLHDAIANLPGSTKARESLVRHALRYLDGLSAEASGDRSLEHELAMAYAKIGDVQGRPMFPNLGQSANALNSYRKAQALLLDVSRAWPESLQVSRDLALTSQRLADLLGVMGHREEALKVALQARQRILAERTRHPGDVGLTRDLGVSCDRLSDMKFAAGDTLGALQECITGLEAIEPLFRANPRDPSSRRSLLIGYTKRAGLFAASGDRIAALRSYRAAEGLAREAVAALPNDAEASRDLSIVYGTIGLFMAEGGDVDSALVVYERGMRIAEVLAAIDPDNALQQADLAAGHFEIGTILMRGRRHDGAEQEFAEAFSRFKRLAAADSANAELRASMARSGRRAGEACGALASSASSPAERARHRARARGWMVRSLELYRQLRRNGELGGADRSAPDEIAALLVTMQGPATR